MRSHSLLTSVRRVIVSLSVQDRESSACRTIANIPFGWSFLAESRYLPPPGSRTDCPTAGSGYRAQVARRVHPSSYGPAYPICRSRSRSDSGYFFGNPSDRESHSDRIASARPISSAIHDLDVRIRSRDGGHRREEGLRGNCLRPRPPISLFGEAHQGESGSVKRAQKVLKKPSGRPSLRKHKDTLNWWVEREICQR